MLKYRIEGPTRLKGEVSVSGAKNSILGLMAATLLAKDEFIIKNVPQLRDIMTMKQVLEIIGAKVEYNNKEKFLYINTRNCDNFEAPYELVSQMRASIYVLGPLLTKYGYCKVSMPGGCAWGPRPINFHLEAMEKMGADIKNEHGYIVATCKNLKGTTIIFDKVSVGATVNVMLAATLAKGTTIIENAAMEPEIVDLANFLRAMGAKISGDGTRTIIIEGVKELKGVEYSAIPDRIEAGTFIAAAIITQGKIVIRNVNIEHVRAVIDKSIEVGAEIKELDDTLEIKMKGRPEPVNILTAPYPGFPTDMQAQFMALLSLAKGTSVITEGIYYDRFMHVMELMRMGADITLNNNTAIINGVKHLTGAKVMASDLRASAALVLAAMAAKGETIISRIYHLERGYEDFDLKLNALGAKIEKFSENQR